MQFSSRLPIAVHILLCLAVFKGQYKLTSSFLAGSIGVNPVIVRNILGQLKAAGLVRVEAGVGGASLARDVREVTLLDVFEAVEGGESLFHLHEKPNPQCPVGRNIQGLLEERLKAVQEAMRFQLNAVTLKDLISDWRSLETP
ncbi:Rrf2 family transcriptional regulator [bacterium]|nr:Rrf2 family transcriptional regulator [bacterium]